MGATYSALFTHFVFSTKRRERWIQPQFKGDLYRYISGICSNIQCSLVGAGGIDDHIHLLVRRHPTKAESDIMRDVKSNSSRWMSAHVPGFRWQDGGGTFSVGPRHVDDVLRYLDGQEEHHRQRSFAEEYQEFLEIAGIEFDPKYMLD